MIQQHLQVTIYIIQPCYRALLHKLRATKMRKYHTEITISSWKSETFLLQASSPITKQHAKTPMKNQKTQQLHCGIMSKTLSTSATWTSRSRISYIHRIAEIMSTSRTASISINPMRRSHCSLSPGGLSLQNFCFFSQHS